MKKITMKYICIFNVFRFQPLKFLPLLPGPKKRTSCYSDNWLSTLATYWNNMESFKLCYLSSLPNTSDFLVLDGACPLLVLEVSR